MHAQLRLKLLYSYLIVQQARAMWFMTVIGSRYVSERTYVAIIIIIIIIPHTNQTLCHARFAASSYVHGCMVPL